MSDSLIYWPANPDPVKVACEAMKRVDGFYRYLEGQGTLARYRKAYSQYYGISDNKSSWQVKAAGSQGELSVLVSNEYRNLLQHLLVLVTQQRPDIQCRAANTDLDSQLQCILGNSLIEYYMRVAKLERYLRQATEISLVLDVGFLLSTWDVTKGDELAADNESGQVLRNGDISYRALTPLDCPYDFTRRDPESHQWYIVRDYCNKFDLAAQYPEKADDILKLGHDLLREETYRFDNFYYFEGMQSEEIPRWTLYHARTPSLPKGRMLQFLSSDIVLFDNPAGIPYRRLPIVRVTPAEMIAKCFGYSPGNDLLGLQDVIDALVSGVTTNTTTFAVSNLWCPPGHNLKVTDLGNGMNLFESKVEPKVISFASFPPELINFLEFCIKRQETLSGVNSTARGNPPSADMSGAALALIQSMALQFQSGLQEAYTQLVEDSGQLTLNHLQDFAKSPRIAQIAGKYNQFQARSFTNQDIKDIQRVYCDQGNPMSKTVSGRMTMADTLLKNQLIHDAPTYLSVMATGRLDPMIEDPLAFQLALRQENEALQSGEQVPVIGIENHQAHINSHYGLIASPDAKKNPQLVQNVLGHIQQHMMEWRGADPALLMALHIPPFPQLQPPPGMMPPGAPPHPMPGHPQMPPPPPQGPQPSPGAHQVQNATPPLMEAAQKVRPPEPPKNALTGRPWNPGTGGL
jgi:hypothetical protein